MNFVTVLVKFLIRTLEAAYNFLARSTVGIPGNGIPPYRVPTDFLRPVRFPPEITCAFQYVHISDESGNIHVTFIIDTYQKHEEELRRRGMEVMERMNILGRPHRWVTKVD